MKNGEAPFFTRRPPLLVSLLFVSAAAAILNEPIRGAAFAVLRFPLIALRAAAGALIALPRLPSLAREHGELRAELVRRQVENAELREQLRRGTQQQALKQLGPFPRGVVAGVIGRSTLPTQQTALVDKGWRDGLTLDSVLLDASGVVGRVAELHASSALVALLTDPESRVAALVERSRETGVLAGRGRGRCELIYLDADADLVAGDRVVTAGLGGPVPKGLLLGRVVRVITDEKAGVASAWVEPAAGMSRIEAVLALPPQSAPADGASEAP